MGKYIAGFIAFVILAFFVLCFRVVGVGKVGIITSFGHVTGEVQSGSLVKGPWPFQTLHTFDIKTQKDEAEAAAASQDLQDVKATIVTNFHLDPTKIGELYRTVGTDYKHRLIDPAIQESVKATTAKYPIQELVTKRQDVKAATLKSLQDRLAPRGIVAEDISFVDMAFSDAFNKAIEAKQVAEQQAQQAKYGVEKASNEAAAAVAKAEGEAKAEIAAAQGKAEAQRLLQQSLTPELLQKNAIDKWNGVLPTYSGSNGTFFNLPVK